MNLSPEASFHYTCFIMLFDDKYRTIRHPSEGVFRDKGSKFLAYAFPVRAEEELKKNLCALKTEHPKAKHHCWAMRLSPDRTVLRLNDDGEPAGTAGRPILNTILSLDLANIGVIVVRYFGGTLLGVPGLINAYKMATTEALANAEVLELTVNDIYKVIFDYIQMNDIMKIVKDYRLIMRSQQFENICEIELEIPKAQLNFVIPNLEKASISTIYLKTI